MAKEKKTIAQRIRSLKMKPGRILCWLAIIPLLMLFYGMTYIFLSYSFTGLVCLCLAGILLFYNVADLLKDKFPKTVRVVRRIFTICLCIGLIIVGITEAIIIKASLGDKDETCDYVVVLGCHVRPSGPSLTLLDRIDAAYEYLLENPDVIAVVSGGQGADEPMTEAQCIYDHLIERGIDPERVWIEDKATSTWENLNFSLNIIEEKTGVRPEKIGIISSEYHLYRASLLADACEVESVGIPATTRVISQRINHYMREVAGVWHYLILGGNYD